MGVEPVWLSLQVNLQIKKMGGLTSEGYDGGTVMCHIDTLQGSGSCWGSCWHLLAFGCPFCPAWCVLLISLTVGWMPHTMGHGWAGGVLHPFVLCARKLGVL